MKKSVFVFFIILFLIQNINALESCFISPEIEETKVRDIYNEKAK